MAQAISIVNKIDSLSHQADDLKKWIKGLRVYWELLLPSRYGFMMLLSFIIYFFGQKLKRR